MINVTNNTAQALSVQVQADDYFMDEITDIDFLIALVREEFIFTDIQMDTLLADLHHNYY